MPDDSPAHTAIGCLFVHGIGQQERGATLDQCGSAISKWLLNWLHPDVALTVEEGANSDNPPDEPHRPSFASLRFSKTPSGPELSRILLAESWWAASFEAPRYCDVARWGIQLLPWCVLAVLCDRSRAILFQHRLADQDGTPPTSQRWRLAISQALELYLTAILCGLLLPVTAILQLVLLVILVLGPTSLGAKLQKWLSELFGDAYSLLQNEESLGRMTEKVRADLRWIAARCDTVLVVAHSQGSALAHEALRLEALEGRALTQYRLVTYGAAVGRFIAMRALVQSSPRAIVAGFSYLIVTGILNLALIAIMLAEALAWEGEQHVPLATDVATMYLIYVLFALVMPAATAFLMPVSLRRLVNRFKEQLSISSDAPVDWTDIYASADPVPNGPLLEPEADGKASKSHPNLSESIGVRNRLNTLLDHTAYWKNLDEFVTRLMTLVAPRTGALRTYVEPDETMVRSARAGRASRLRWLSGIRSIAMLWAIAVCVTVASEASPRSTTLWSWAATVAIVFGLVFLQWSLWNESAQLKFLRSHKSSSKEPTGMLLVAAAVVLPAVVTVVVEVQLPSAVLLVLGLAIAFFLGLQAIAFRLTSPSRRFGLLTTPVGELRRGSLWTSACSAVIAAMAWHVWVIEASGLYEHTALADARAPLLVLAWIALLSALLGYTKGTRLSQALSVVGFSGMAPILLSVFGNLWAVVACLAVLGCTYVMASGFDEAARKLNL